MADTKVDLIARGMHSDDVDPLIKEVLAQAGHPPSISPTTWNLMMRTAMAAHRRGWNEALGRVNYPRIADVLEQAKDALKSAGFCSTCTDGPPEGEYCCRQEHWNAIRAIEALGVEAKPIDMVLHCPKCGLQHIDEPEEKPRCQCIGCGGKQAAWTNPPHRSHFCARCKHVWRPADVPTNGVQAVQTQGKADSPVAQQTAETLTKAKWNDPPEYLLRAMSRNYADGHQWDQLDGIAVTRAADEIEALRTALATTANLPAASHGLHVGKIVMDGWGRPTAVLTTVCDSEGNFWANETPLYLATGVAKATGKCMKCNGPAHDVCNTYACKFLEGSVADIQQAHAAMDQASDAEINAYTSGMAVGRAAVQQGEPVAEVTFVNKDYPWDIGVRWLLSVPEIKEHSIEAGAKLYLATKVIDESKE